MASDRPRCELVWEVLASGCWTASPVPWEWLAERHGTPSPKEGVPTPEAAGPTWRLARRHRSRRRSGPPAGQLGAEPRAAARGAVDDESTLDRGQPVGQAAQPGTLPAGTADTVVGDGEQH